MNGLQDLMMFRDNLQEPEPTGLERLALLSDLTAGSMADEGDMQYAASGGLVNLPVVQAGFGGFLKKAIRAFNRLPTAKIFGRAVVRPLSKSKVGNVILGLAPLLGGNPAAAAAIAGSIAAMKDPKAEGNPYKVTQAAARAAAAEAIKGQIAESSKAANMSEFVGAPGSDSALQAQRLAEASTVSTPAATNVFSDLGQSVTGGAGYDPSGTFVSRLGDRVAGSGEFVGKSFGDQTGFSGEQPNEVIDKGGTTGGPAGGLAMNRPVGDGPVLQGTYTETPLKYDASTIADSSKTADDFLRESLASNTDAATNAAKYADLSTVDKIKNSLSLSGPDYQGTLIGRELNRVPYLNKLIPDGTMGQLALGAAGAQALMPEEEQPDLPEGLQQRQVETDYGKVATEYYRINPETGEEEIVPTDRALELIQSVYKNYNPNYTSSQGVGALTSGVKTRFIRPEDTQLAASGGLIGMAYGGKMPQDGLDVRYKEFSGMVGGQGDGMQDNVYMPIVERDNGQQVATLAVSPKEYVVDANTMSLLGNGNPDAGAQIMDATVKDVRMAATGQRQQQKEIDGLQALNRMRRV
tara:strand:- start:6143 stop:7879 length:1737 start_codon:yes stop_codon:yes gene_type:complete